MANPRNLPPELLMAIVSFLAESSFANDWAGLEDEAGDADQIIATLAALSVTNSFFNAVAEPHLYRIGPYRHPYLLCWATEVGFLNVMKKILTHYEPAGLMISTGIIRYSPRKYKEWNRTSSTKQRFWELYRQDEAGGFQSRHDWNDECEFHAHVTDSDADSDDEEAEHKDLNGFMAEWYGVLKLKTCDHFKVDVMQKAAVYWFPVHIAAKQGNLDALTILVEHGALLNVSSKGFCVHPHDPYNRNVLYFPDWSAVQDSSYLYPAWTPYHIALCHGHVEVAKYILTECPYITERLIGTDEDPQIQVPPFISAIRRGLPGVAEFCLEEGIDDPNALYPGLSFATLLWRALWETKDFGTAMEILLRHGADLEHDLEDGHTLLMDACCRGHYREAIALIDAGASVGVVLEEPGVELDEEFDDRSLVSSHDLLGSGLLDVCCTGRPILASKHHSPEALVPLIARLYASEARDASKRNPILTASKHHQIDVIKFLLSAGSDLHALDSAGDGVLNYASRLPLTRNQESWSKGLYQTLLFLTQQAKESGISLQGGHRAASSLARAHARDLRYSNLQVKSQVRRAFLLLVKEGLVNLNARDAYDKTLLMKAVFDEDFGVAGSLINLGAEAGVDPRTGRDDLVDMWDHAVDHKDSALLASRLLRKLDRQNRISHEPRFLVVVMMRRLKSIEEEMRPSLFLDKNWVNNECLPSTITTFHDAGIEPQVNEFPLWRLLHFAVYFGFCEISKILLGAGARVHGFTETGETALSLITAKEWSGPKELAELVVKHSVDQDPNAPSRCYDMLERAMENDCEDYVLAVLDICPVSNTKGAQSLLLLHLAIKYMSWRRPAVISRLVSSGADVNACDKDGNTPLAYLLTRVMTCGIVRSVEILWSYHNSNHNNNICTTVSTLIRSGTEPGIWKNEGQSVLGLLTMMKERKIWYCTSEERALRHLLRNTLLYDVMVYRQKV